MRTILSISLVLLTLASHAGERRRSAIQTVRDLSSDVSECGTDAVPFHFTATVLYVCENDEELMAALSDESGNGIVFFPHGNTAETAKPGNVIRCSGLISSTEPHERHARVRKSEIVARSSPPSPVTATVSELRSGAFDHRVIRLSGHVYDAQTSETNPNWVHLSLTDGKSVIYASIRIKPREKANCERLISTFVTLDGFCLPQEDGYRRHLGRTIKVYGLDSLRVIGSVSDDRSVIPDIAALANANTDEIPVFVRHRVCGRVIAVWDGQVLVSTPKDTLVRISLATAKVPSFGQLIEAVGYPETDLFSISLTRAT